MQVPQPPIHSQRLLFLLDARDEALHDYPRLHDAPHVHDDDDEVTTGRRP